jgi:hypothetical protein
LPARSAFDVTPDDSCRSALVDAAKLARANGQLVAWDSSVQEYAIGLYHEDTHQVQPLTDEEAAIVLNRDQAIRRAWRKWNAASRNGGSLIVLDAERARRILAVASGARDEDDEIEGLA